MKTITLKWKKLNPLAELPYYATAGAAAFDMKAALDRSMTLEPGQVYLIPTGLAVEVPEGFELQLRARSGLAAKYGLTLVNGVGTIDSDYRGEIKVIVMLLGKQSLTIQNGDRVCQGLVAPVLKVTHSEVFELSDSERGQAGFGSTGLSK